MTTICAMREPSVGVWIGADSMVCNTCTRQYGAMKWILSEPWAIGVAGDLRVINLLEARKDSLLAEPPGAWTLLQRVRDAMLGDGIDPRSMGDEPGVRNFGSDFIFAHPGGVWSASGEHSLVEIADGELWADGSGRGFALGAGYLAARNGESPEACVRSALDAALRYDVHTGGETFVRLIRA